MTWAGFAGIFVLFFATHSIPVRPPIKSRTTAMIGDRGFAVSYSILSIAMLGLLIWAAGEAPYIELWSQAVWHRHAAHIGMLAVCLILALSLARPNPFSFGGVRNESFDPADPGIVRLTRHPILVALALWAGVHLLANGDLAHLLLFGVLGGFALAGRSLVDRRKKYELGLETWEQLNAAVNGTPLLSTARYQFSGAVRIACGLAVFAALFALHPAVVGVSIL